jgi:pimeloyl-ACP methyl ester carboxylesterase
VYALDFTGHGRSTVPAGGGYTPEILIADVDAALARIGPSTVVGYGLGAYVALLIAGSRPSHVRGAILCDGPGLAGSGPQPPRGVIAGVDETSISNESPDHWALLELSQDPRPPEYAVNFVQDAAKGSSVDPVIAVAASESAPWLDAVLAESPVAVLSLDEALSRYARYAST